MNSSALSNAIRSLAIRLRNSDSQQPPTIGELADTAELLVVLSRILEGQRVDQAFGSPGDWGYSHPIGRALAQSEVTR